MKSGKSRAQEGLVTSMCNVHECALPMIVVLLIATDATHTQKAFHTHTHPGVILYSVPGADGRVGEG